MLPEPVIDPTSKNLTEEDIRKCIDINASFSEYEFEVELNHCDLYFWGIKK